MQTNSFLSRHGGILTPKGFQQLKIIMQAQFARNTSDISIIYYTVRSFLKVVQLVVYP